MYKNRRVKKIFIVWFVISFWLWCWAFWFDLLDEINSKIQKLGDALLDDGYMSRAYSPDFSKDPFWDAVSNKMDVFNKSRLAWVQYVKKSLEAEGCPLSDKKINWILYNYVTGFKENLVRDMKIELWNYDTTKYELDDTKVLEYCKEYFSCIESKEYTTWQLVLNKCLEKDDDGNCIRRPERPITKWTSANLKTNCVEFFERKYYEWQYNEFNKQKVKVSQIWADKYWNNTVDDSPYDIIEDFGEVAKLLFLEAQDPITPVFYHMPNFSNSENALRKWKDFWTSSEDGSSSSGNEWTSEDLESWSDEGQEEWDEDGNQTNQWEEDGWETGESSETLVSPLWTDEVPDYDDLLEWLGAYKLTTDGSEFYTNLCDNREWTESEIEEDSDKNYEFWGKSLDVDDISEEEYQEIVDYMLDAVDDYTSLPSEIDDEIEEESWDKSDFGSESSAEDLEKRADEVKNCWKSCEWLRIDQRASCMVKCACWEITSADDEIFGVKNKVKLFDSKEFPWLWPILLIRFCAVPAVDTRFSVWWKRIHSIEEWLKEIYGVVDKLSREWKLWKWTQQYEFLDSSTKRMNFADSFTFTIDVEFVDIWNKMPKQSEQFKKKELKKDDEIAQIQNGVKNPLNEKAGLNGNATVGNSSTAGESSVWDSTNSERDKELTEDAKEFVDLFEDAYADIHVKTESHLSLWLKQQWELWINAEKYIKDLRDAAMSLNQKAKCKN